jgi:hypothetical protein
MLKYKFAPVLSKSLKNAPFLNPSFPVGTVFPSASKISPSESYLTTSFVL